MQRFSNQVDEFVAGLPPIEELRARLAENLEERDLLRQMIRLAEQKSKCGDKCRRQADDA